MVMLKRRDEPVPLKNLIPINTLADEHFAELAGRLTISTAKKGEIILKHGDTLREHVFLLSGKVGLLAGEQEIESISAGDSNARFALAHYFPRRYSVRAKTKISYVRIDSRYLSELQTKSSSNSYEVNDIDYEESGDWMTRILQSEVFKHVPTANLQRLMMHLQKLDVKTGDVIIQQGNHGDSFYVISDGRCRVTRTVSDNSSTTELAQLGPGDCFGEEALLSNDLRGGTVTMISDGILIQVTKKDFIDLIAKPICVKVDFVEAESRIAEGACWLDVRSQAAFNAAHLPGSSNLSLADLRFGSDNLASDTAYIICSEDPSDSSVVAFWLSQRGIDVVALNQPVSQILNGTTQTDTSNSSEPESVDMPESELSITDVMVDLSLEPQADDPVTSENDQEVVIENQKLRLKNEVANDQLHNLKAQFEKTAEELNTNKVALEKARDRLHLAEGQEKQVKVLEHKAAEYKDEARVIQAERESVAKDLAALRKQMKNSEHRFDLEKGKLKEDLTLLVLQLEEAQSDQNQAEDHASELAKLTQVVADVESKQAGIVQQKEALQRELATADLALEQEQEERDGVIEKHQSDLKNLEQSLAQSIESGEKSAARIHDLEEVLEGSPDADSLQQLEEKIQLLEVEVHELDKHHEQALEQVAELEGQDKQLIDQLAELQRTSDEADQRVTAAESKLATELQQHEDTLKEMLQREVELLQHLDDEKSALKVLQIELDASELSRESDRTIFDEELTQLKEDITQQTDLVETERDNNQSLTAELKSAKKTSDDVSDECQSLSGQKDELATRLIEHEKRYAVLEQEHETAQGELRTLESLVNQKDSELEALVKSLEQTGEAAENAASDVWMLEKSNFETTLKDKDVELLALGDAYKTVQNSVQEFEELTKKKDQELDELSRHLETAEAALESAEQDEERHVILLAEKKALEDVLNEQGQNILALEQAMLVSSVDDEVSTNEEAAGAELSAQLVQLEGVLEKATSESHKQEAVRLELEIELESVRRDYTDKLRDATNELEAVRSETASHMVKELEGVEAQEHFSHQLESLQTLLEEKSTALDKAEHQEQEMEQTVRDHEAMALAIQTEVVQLEQQVEQKTLLKSKTEESLALLQAKYDALTTKGQYENRFYDSAEDDDSGHRRGLSIAAGFAWLLVGSIVSFGVVDAYLVKTGQQELVSQINHQIWPAAVKPEVAPVVLIERPQVAKAAVSAPVLREKISTKPVKAKPPQVLPPVAKKPDILEPLKPTQLPQKQAAATSTLSRDSMVDGSSGPLMVRVAGGRLNMGSRGKLARSAEQPEHNVSFTAFAMSRYEITFAEYDRFVEATGREYLDDEGWGRGQQPVVNVSWTDAMAYTQWLSEQTGNSYSLPSESQWEYAASAGSQYAYWWGADVEAGRAVCADCGTQWDGSQGAPVGSQRPNGFGLHDTAGNVMEWTADCENANYQGAPVNGDAWLQGECGRRMVRGGAFNQPADRMRSAARNAYHVDDRFNMIGFRVIKRLG